MRVIEVESSPAWKAGWPLRGQPLPWKGHLEVRLPCCDPDRAPVVKSDPPSKPEEEEVESLLAAVCDYDTR